jgi:hypothetical protein
MNLTAALCQTVDSFFHNFVIVLLVECEKKAFDRATLLNSSHFRLAFPTGQDSATLRDKGTEVASLSRDKGTTGQAKNLAKGQDGPGQPKFGTGRDSQNPGRDAGQNGTEQKRTF